MHLDIKKKIIYYDFIEKYGDLEYDFSMIDENEKPKIIEK